MDDVLDSVDYDELIRPSNFFDGWTLPEFIDWCNMSEDDEELWWTFCALYEEGMTYHSNVVLWLLIGEGQNSRKYGKFDVQATC